jgi:hypothetical protein
VSGICINAYEIEGTESLAWPVRRYAVRRRDGVELRQEDRGHLKDAAFGLRREYRGQCSGYGFIIDADQRTLIVPQTFHPVASPGFGLGVHSMQKVSF